MDRLFSLANEYVIFTIPKSRAPSTTRNFRKLSQNFSTKTHTIYSHNTLDKLERLTHARPPTYRSLKEKKGAGRGRRVSSAKLRRHFSTILQSA